MERCGLEVLDVENLRRHYALTLDGWAERFDRNWEAIHALDPQRFDERFRRIWRTYLWSCAEVFRAKDAAARPVPGDGQQGQRRHDNYPMSRSFLYRRRRTLSRADMSPPGRPRREHRSAQHEGAPMSAYADKLARLAADLAAAPAAAAAAERRPRQDDVEPVPRPRAATRPRDRPRPLRRGDRGRPRRRHRRGRRHDPLRRPGRRDARARRRCRPWCRS